MDFTVLLVAAVLGWAFSMGGFVAGWYVTNEHWKRAFPLDEPSALREWPVVLTSPLAEAYRERQRG